MKPYNTNFFYTKHAFTGSTVRYTVPIEGWGLEQITFSINVETLTGSPTTASLTGVIQVCSMQYGGYNLDTEPAGDLRKWIDVTAAHTGLGHMLIGGDFPSPIADQTLGANGVLCVRRLKLEVPHLVRLALTPTYSGGTTPAFNVGVAATMY